MNEENNLNTVPNTNVEPVQQPVQPTAPVQPVTPVEPVQQPVAPVQPTAPVTPAPQVDAEAIMEQKVVEMEQEMMKEKIEPPVEQHEEVTTEEVAKPVEPQIDPSFGTNVQPPIQPVPEPTKKKSKLPVILIVLVILAAGGFACWKFVLPMLNKETKAEETTTTTTTTKKVASIPFNTFAEFLDMAGTSDTAVFDDKTSNFTLLEMNTSEKCQTDGQNVSYEIDSYKIEYVCKYVTEEDDPVDGPYYSPENITVNGTYKFEAQTYNTLYANGKYYLDFTPSVHSVEQPNLIVISDTNGNKVFSAATVPYYKETETDINGRMLSIVNKDNVIYYLKADSDGQTTCKVKYIDLNEDKPEEKETDISASCYTY